VKIELKQKIKIILAISLEFILVGAIDVLVQHIAFGSFGDFLLIVVGVVVGVFVFGSPMKNKLIG